MNSQGCRERFEWPIAVSLAKEVESKGCDPSCIEEASQGLVGRTVLAGEKSMAQQDELRRWPVGRAQDRGNAVVLAIVKGQRFFQGVIFQSSGTLGE